MKESAPIPTLPQTDSIQERALRTRDVQLARTAYNYMFSYLEPVPMSANVPPGEAFTLAYEAKIFPVLRDLAANYIEVVKSLIAKEFQGTMPPLPLQSVQDVTNAWRLHEEDKGSLLHPVRGAKETADLLRALAAAPADLQSVIQGLVQVTKDIASVVEGLEESFKKIEQQGPTAFLKYPLYEVINPSLRRDYLAPSSVQDYVNLYHSLPLPLTLTLPMQPWMKLEGDEQPWEQDWFFGYEQIAGYNTTQIQGVILARTEQRGGILLNELLQKFPITDAMLQEETEDPAITLESAARAGHLYVCDYAMLEGVPGSELFGQRRYLSAPIALFYWNRQPPKGYPPSAQGVMQPIVIQLGQQPDPEATPIFRPHDGDKWRIAKLFVQNACTLQHEAVAHLGACHLTIEPMIVATHRQLPPQHPILVLLIPHFRFTLAINQDALSGLIIPGGAVATDLSPSIEGFMDIVRSAHLAWRFDENEPRRLFHERGVGCDDLPDFPFRDDTLLLWDALLTFVGKYLRLYYQSDADVVGDHELQRWMNELVSPRYASVRGLDGLVNVGTADEPEYQIQSLEYLIQVISQIIYIAGPQHASVNYAQYPLMSFLPSVPGSVYQPPPTKSSVVEDPLKWLPPLDVSLYQVSFTYLLSMVQYDTLGIYSTDPRDPYFADPRVNDLVAELQSDLAVAELTIRKRNQTRPMPYLFQLPSMVPNSISI